MSTVSGAKMGLFRRQSAVLQSLFSPILTFFRSPINCVCVGPNFMFFWIVGRFFKSLNSLSSNPRSSSDHCQAVCDVCRHWDIWNFLKCRPTYTYLRQKIDRGGRLVYWAILTNRIPIPFNILPLLVDRSMRGGQPDDAMHQTFFVCKWKQYQRGYRWIFSDCEIVYIISRH